MKKLLLAFLLFGYCHASKTLKNVEVFSSDISAQAIFFFSEKCSSHPEVIESDSRVSVFFPSIKLGAIDHQALSAGLNNLAVIENISLRNEQKKTNGKFVDGVLLDIKFHDKKALVKLVQMADSNKFILEVYSKEKLEKLNKLTSGPLQLACSDIPKKKKDSKFRIVVDAGHGGKSIGAKGLYNLVEKEVTLDISKKLKSILEQQGYEVCLTRDADQDVSLVNRCRQAEAFNADLFVSIHANSAGKSQSPKGIETFHLNSNQLVGRVGRNLHKFLLVQSKHDRELANLANNLVKKNESLSHRFAGSIQNRLVSMLNQKNLNVTNRGVKKSCFLVLLGLVSKLSLPTALVEVGFITNPDEARRLSNNNYRGMLALGIAKGIKSFLES